MGEHIPSAAQLATTDPANAAVNGVYDRWSECVALLPPTYTRSEQEELLVLAWVLILARGTVQNEDGAFAWGVAGAKDTTPVMQGGIVAEVIGAETEPLTKALEAIHALRKESSSDDDTLVLLNAAPSAEWSFALEAKLAQNQLYIRQLPRTPSANQPVAAVLPDVLADIFTSLLTSLDRTVADAVRIGKRELAHIWQWNHTVPPNIDICVHDMIAANAQRQPERPAVVSWDGEMTYAELDGRSTRLAHRLLDLGLKVGTPVPLCFEKSMWTIVGVLAVMKAGGALVLMDPSQPEGRLKTIATEVGAEIILTSVAQTALGQNIVPGGTQIAVGPAMVQDDATPLPTTPALPTVPMSSTCYIQFTSGSTGKPKGVVISHANYTSGAVPRADAVGYNENSRVLDFPSYAFDVSVDCMLCTLAKAGCICVPSEDARVNDLSGAIRGMNVNMAHMTPSVARVLDSDIMPQLEVLGLGGEAITASDAADWGQKTKIVIAYGPSECTVGCTINNNVPLDRPYTSIGLGVGGCSWVVDPADHNRLMPVGAVGELLVEGPIVGDGYLNEPEKTRAVFIEDPSWLVAGGGNAVGRQGRLYKTGDLVRYDPDASGAVVFIGRADQQVKLRGQRVELGEIEHHIRNHLPAGASVAAEVIAPGGKKSDSILVVFVAEQKSESTGSACEITSFSKEYQTLLAGMDEAIGDDLPRYMIPAAYIPLDQMPLLVSLKTDRKQLRALGNSLTRRRLAELKLAHVEKTPPSTDMEKRLHALWLTMFGGDAADLGIQDHFFSLGGDSLKAMKLVAAAREQGLALRVTDIFRSPTLGALAATMTEIRSEDNADIAPFSMLPAGWDAEAAKAETAALCGLDAAVIEDVYPCTPLQEALMALSAKVADAYTAQRVVELPDETTTKRLRAAFEQVTKDCAIMRTRIVQVPRRGLMQVVLSTNTPWAESNDLSEYLARDTDNLMGLGTDLARFAAVHDEANGKHHLVLSIHHALYDGWSMPLVIDRVNRAYRGEAFGSPAPFKSFIRWLGENDRKVNEAYWADQLEGATALQFPVVPYQGYQARADSLLEHYVQLPKSASSSTTSIATAIRGAWALLASQYTATDDVVFGETLTGRNAPVAAVEGIEGPMITTVPVRVRVDATTSAAEYLEQIHEQMVHRIPHEHTGLQHIRRLNSDAREACELRTGIVIHPTVEEEQTLDLQRDPATGFMPTSEGEAAREALKFNSYSLMLVFTVDPNGFLVMASFDSKTVDVPQMDRALKHFARLVQQILADPSQSVQDIFAKTQDEDLSAQQQPLSTVGPASLPAEEAYAGAVATWIVDPTNPEQLVPSGGVGELLIQRESSEETALATPSWLASSSPVYTTNQLAKYTADGRIIILRRKDEQIVNRQGARNRKEPHDKSLLPTTPKQKKLQQVWAQVLDIPADEIVLSDNFFDLGGDSIRAMKLVSEARMDGLKLTVTTVFDHRPLFDMAEHAEEIETSSESAAAAAPAYQPFSTLDVPNVDDFIESAVRPALAQPEWKVTDVYPTRPLQEIAVNATVGLPRFSVRYELFHLDVAVNRRKLFDSCRELVARNEILRTVFVEHEGISYGVVVEDHPCPIVEYELDAGADVEAFSRQVCDVDVQATIPLGSPFCKFFLVQPVGGGASSLILRISHAQYDEICLPILLEQLSALYEDRPVPMGLPFSSFVAHTLRENIPASVPYWRELLQGSTMSRLQPGIPSDPTRHYAVFKEVSIASRPRDVTVATLPTAAWAICLAKRLSTRDVVFGEVVSGRNNDMPNADAVVGPCWQYVPVRIAFQPEWTARDLLQTVQRQHLASARFEGMGLKEIVAQCTDWPATVDWFDTVVHQDVEHVEDLSFLGASSRMQTVYPHFEPLREIKVQAFPRGDMLGIEIVTTESWKELGDALLEEMLQAVTQLVTRVDSSVL